MLSSRTQFRRVVWSFHLVFRDVTGLLPSFTGFYGVLPSLIKMNWVIYLVFLHVRWMY